VPLIFLVCMGKMGSFLLYISSILKKKKKILKYRLGQPTGLHGPARVVLNFCDPYISWDEPVLPIYMCWSTGLGQASHLTPLHETIFFVFLKKNAIHVAFQLGSENVNVVILQNLHRKTEFDIGARNSYDGVVKTCWTRTNVSHWKVYQKMVTVVNLRKFKGIGYPPSSRVNDLE